MVFPHLSDFIFSCSRLRRSRFAILYTAPAVLSGDTKGTDKVWTKTLQWKVSWSQVDTKEHGSFLVEWQLAAFVSYERGQVINSWVWKAKRDNEQSCKTHLCPNFSTDNRNWKYVSVEAAILLIELFCYIHLNILRLRGLWNHWIE